jgi:subtilisin family serine protease
MLYRIGKAPGTLTGQGVTVGVIDTGLDLSHPDIPLLFFNTKELLNGKDDDNNGYVDDIYGVDIFSNDGIPEDLHGHGTLVTGVIKQVAPECLISPIKIAGESGASNDVYISNGIHYAINRGVKIINLSTSLLGPSNRVYQALQRAEQAGIVVLIGAGNTGESVPSFPARYADSIHNIIVVGSYGANGISNFSNKSGGVYPYVLAPGEYVISTTLGGGTGYCQGTSFACAHVTGLIAQLLQTIPNLSIAGIKDILMMSSGNFL